MARFENLTPEQQAGVEAIIQDWMRRLLEFKTDENGTLLFRRRQPIDEKNDNQSPGTGSDPL